MYRVGRRAPDQNQNLQKAGDRRGLVRLPVDLHLAENEAGPGLESLHQMQSGLLRGIHDRAPEHLAVDRQLLRIESVGQVGERVVARRAALELHDPHRNSHLHLA